MNLNQASTTTSASTPEKNESKRNETTEKMEIVKSTREEKENATKVEARSSSQTTDDKQQKVGSEGNATAPPVGSRIEVLWKIEDSGVEQERWWGATVQDCTPETVGDAAKGKYKEHKIHILLYDAYDSFSEETSRVVFLADSTLLDLSMAEDENGGILDWRREGDVEASQADESVNMAEVARNYDAVAQQVGLSHDADLQALGQFSAHVQGAMASGYRNFADSIKQMLGELMSQKPEGYVVTEADVRDMFAKLHATRAN